MSRSLLRLQASINMHSNSSEGMIKQLLHCKKHVKVSAKAMVDDSNWPEYKSTLADVIVSQDYAHSPNDPSIFRSCFAAFPVVRRTSRPLLSLFLTVLLKLSTSRLPSQMSPQMAVLQSLLARTLMKS